LIPPYYYHQVTNEVFSGIKIIKLYAWERSFEVRTHISPFLPPSLPSSYLNLPSLPPSLPLSLSTSATKSCVSFGSTC